MSHLWLRAETKPFEKRTPLLPQQAESLLAEGHEVTVESSPERIVPDEAYAAVGCQLAPTGSWSEAPTTAYILGLKALPEVAMPLRHTHLYFGHAYKGQTGGQALLQRFVEGKGRLLDLEYLTDEAGVRVASFGRFAGITGAFVAVLLWLQKKTGQQPPFQLQDHYPSQEGLVQQLLADLGPYAQELPKALIIGAHGRVGGGVIEVLDELGLTYSAWDKKETAQGGPFSRILQHELFFNTVFLNDKVPPFMTHELLQQNKRLSIVADISCDPTSDFNPLPIYTAITTFGQPTHRVLAGEHPVDLVAIDHLPSFLPTESSADFAEQLFPHLLDLLQQGPATGPWERAAALFLAHTR